MILCCAVAGATGCHQVNRYDRSAADGYAKVTFQVNGMMKTQSGAT